MQDKTKDIEIFKNRRVAEVESDAYQLAKKAFLTSEEAKQAFYFLLQQVFEVSDLDEDVYEIQCSHNSLMNRVCQLEDDLRERVDEMLAEYLGIPYSNLSQLMEEKGGLEQRISSCEQKLNALRARKKELREDGLMQETIDKLVHRIRVLEEDVQELKTKKKRRRWIW